MSLDSMKCAHTSHPRKIDYSINSDRNRKSVYKDVCNKREGGSESDYQIYKFLLVGDASVGKSSFLNQYIEGKAPSTFIPTIGIDFRNKKLSYKYSYSNAQGSVAVAYHKVCVQLWDTAGMERFHSLTTSYFRDAKGFFLMIDLTNENTFVNAFAWLQKMEEYGPRSGYDVIIVGNKIDLVDRRKISAETLHKFAENHRLPYVETSAKTGINIEESIDMMLHLAIFRHRLSFQKKLIHEEAVPAKLSHSTTRRIKCSCI
ncbi:ras-related protein Rab-27A-like [Octopus sinensis]|uniref:Ras-related protein Rab-27A-like n=1 Tax=Octopus sinensis TaxID=2607531 RepID=A0A7E6FSY7_9MOLL|nr:ras-related protein Rab-27A-like [Octopus sinensis]